MEWVGWFIAIIIGSFALVLFVVASDEKNTGGQILSAGVILIILFFALKSCVG